MAKYQARPFYAVRIDNARTIEFDYYGQYETDCMAEISLLDSLVPSYVQHIDEPEPIAPEEDEPEPVAPKVEHPKADEVKTEDKPSTRRKASAK